MNIDAFLDKLKQSPEAIDFNELMELIDENYDFTPTAFQNGDLKNQADENNGSCKLFYFAELNGLSKDQTLACFGAYYRDDVLKHPEGDNHQNIRNFMQFAWDGIVFDSSDVLVAK